MKNIKMGSNLYHFLILITLIFNLVCKVFPDWNFVKRADCSRVFDESLKNSKWILAQSGFFVHNPSKILPIRIPDIFDKNIFLQIYQLSWIKLNNIRNTKIQNEKFVSITWLLRKSEIWTLHLHRANFQSRLA